MSSPTQRSLKELRECGWTAQVVERFNPHARVRVDLFGCIDIVAIDPAGGIVGIQACAGASHSARKAKIMAEPKMGQWLNAGGRVELWSWAKRGPRGKRKVWTLRKESITTTDAKE